MNPQLVAQLIHEQIEALGGSGISIALSFEEQKRYVDAQAGTVTVTASARRFKIAFDRVDSHQYNGRVRVDRRWSFDIAIPAMSPELTQAHVATVLAALVAAVPGFIPSPAEAP